MSNNIGKFAYDGTSNGNAVYRNSDTELVAILAPDNIMAPAAGKQGIEAPGRGAKITEVSAMWAKKLDEFSAGGKTLPTTFCYARDKSATGFESEKNPLNTDFTEDERTRATIVCNVDVLPLDFYVTGYMYGRFYDMYEDDVREICGVNLADGMKSGSRLPSPFFYASQRGTISGATGNAGIMGIEKIVAYLKTNNWSSRMVKTGASKFLFGEAKKLATACINAYRMAEEYADGRGLTLATAKFTIGVGDVGQYYFGGLWLTPDQSDYQFVCPLNALDTGRIIGRVTAETSPSKAEQDLTTIRDWLSG